MGTDNVSSVCGVGATDSYCSLPSLSGGGKLKYPPKATTQQPTRSRILQEPLAALPAAHGRHHAQWRSEVRHVTSRSVPVHSADRRDDDRGSNSAPTETGRHHTNHDRQPRVHVPRLPRINNLVKDPLQQQIHGTSTATEAGRRETGWRRWASSWADARANSSSVSETKNAADNSIHQPNGEVQQQTPEKLGQTKEVHKTPSSPIKSISPRTVNNATVKFSERTAQKVPAKQSEVTRNEAQETKTVKNGSVVQGKGDNVGRLKPDRRTQSTSQIETNLSKPSPTRSKSSAVLTNVQEITRQSSQTLPAKPSTSSASPRREISQISTVSQGSHGTGASPQSKQPSHKKRSRKPVIITRKSLMKQKTLQSVYGNRTYKCQRQIRVLQKMEEIQRREVEEFNRELKAKEKQRMESIVKQRMSLKRVRDRFDEEQVRRFCRQYVSWKSVEEDRLKRSSEQYGLPDFIYEDRYEKTLKTVPGPESSATAAEGAAAAPSKKSPKKFHKYAAWVRNIKVFERLLNPKVGGNLEQTFKSNRKTIVEGIDTVKLDSDDDSEPTKKVNVKRLIGSAKKLLTVTENSDDVSELSPFQDDDDFSSLVLSDDNNDQ